MDELTREEGREWPATSHGTLPTFTLINILPVFLFTGWFFNCPPPPNFSTKKKIAKQPITAFLSYMIF